MRKAEAGAAGDRYDHKGSLGTPATVPDSGAPSAIPGGVTWGEVPNYDGSERATSTGTSIFDPTLCELVYRWFCPPGGLVLDPFAGGSVRGVVAAVLGRPYVGFELRPEQVAANREQWAAMTAARRPGSSREPPAGDPDSPAEGRGGAVPDGIPADAPDPAWIVGDSAETIPAQPPDLGADLVFSCPPFWNLEVYSDDPDDLSTLGYAAFLGKYRAIIAAACARLRDDRFACFVVGEVRDAKGFYVNLVGDTVRAFQDAGLHYYNEAALVTMVGSLPVRAGKQFVATRKLGRTHQAVLVFLKGDPRRAAAACGPADHGEPEGPWAGDGGPPGDDPASDAEFGEPL